MPVSNLLLAAHLRRNRLASAYVLTGPRGEAKSQLALDFSRSLNCESQKVFEACECLSCHKIIKGIHPDVRWLGRDEKTRSIKIEEVRTMLQEAALKPYEGRWKVFILEGAERLTLDAANALLKTLEEPPPHSVFLLLVVNKFHLLETVQSRCFEIRIAPRQDPGTEVRQTGELLKAGGWKAFLAQLREVSRPELAERLEVLMFYLRDQSASLWTESRQRSGEFLNALESVYETQEALAANVNQKLALTHLEIRLGKVFHA